MILNNKKYDILSDQEYDFVKSIDARFPDRNILKNFNEFIETPPADRLQLARDNLEKCPRLGYVVRGIPLKDVESVAQHTKSGIKIANEKTPAGLSSCKVATIFDIHDLCETMASDFIPRDPISKEEKKRLEYLAIKIIAEDDEKILEYWLMFEEAELPEAKFAQDVDKLQMYDRSVEYGHTHPTVDLNDIMDNVEKRQWMTVAGEEIFKDMRMARKPSSISPGPGLN